MGITDRFCPKCGKPSEHGGLCSHCRVADTRWFTCDRRVVHVQCPSCGATRVANTWSDVGGEREDLGPSLARGAVHLHPDVRKASVTVDISDTGSTRSRARVTVKGTLYGLPVEGVCTVEIAWQKEQCDRCNRITGSYYEGVVQVRAEGRLPSPFEKQQAAAIAQAVEDSLQQGGERLSFLSDITETRDGLDIVIGSQHIGQMISQRITAELGGRFTTHPKLVGEKAGRQLFRITYSVRLPRFQKQDVVFTGGHFGEIEQGEGHTIRIFDLNEGRGRSVREDAIERVVGSARSAVPALVAFTDGTTMGVLDPDTCQNRELRVPPWLNARAGQQVRVLRDGDTLVVVR